MSPYDTYLAALRIHEVFRSWSELRKQFCEPCFFSLRSAIAGPPCCGWLCVHYEARRLLLFRAEEYHQILRRQPPSRFCDILLVHGTCHSPRKRGCRGRACAGRQCYPQPACNHHHNGRILLRSLRLRYEPRAFRRVELCRIAYLPFAVRGQHVQLAFDVTMGVAPYAATVVPYCNEVTFFWHFIGDYHQSPRIASMASNFFLAWSMLSCRRFL